MFFERSYNNSMRSGWIEVICGSMFSGKTEELLRRLRRAQIAKQRVEIYKPKIDTRYDDVNIVSHDENAIPSKPVETAEEILFYAGDVDVIGIDEAQFFDNELANVCNKLADQGIRVIVAGLDMDFQRNPFGPMPALIASAEYIDKVHAICVKCGNLAQYSHRTTANKEQVLLGETDSYEPLCRACYLMEQQRSE
ncbi:thymidine kinase [Bacteroidales bacterium OttesenSCG-928-K03]|nr:thymidine kinase [Bacteroidales bacterium OttesenSCG-928-K22]MDL2242249.1 thymidine kinase [Bacteroidales bacterium OttesenSCG-928-K03]